MRRIRRHVSYASVVASIALFIALSSGAYAVAGNPFVGRGGGISVCVQSADHVLQALKPGTRCAAGDVALTLNQKGRRGPAGPQGVQGPVGPSTGAAGGDLTGNYPNPTIAPGAVTTSKLADGAVTNSKLVNPSLTVTAGTGLTGGGSIALGGSGTLTVDPTAVQTRVSGTCSSGTAVSSIAQNGSVACTSSPAYLEMRTNAAQPVAPPLTGIPGGTIEFQVVDASSGITPLFGDPLSPTNVTTALIDSTGVYELNVTLLTADAGGGEVSYMTGGVVGVSAGTILGTVPFDVKDGNATRLIALQAGDTISLINTAPFTMHSLAGSTMTLIRIA